MPEILTMPRVRLLAPHSANCFMKSLDNPWAFFGSHENRTPPKKRVLYLGADGRRFKNDSGSYRWLTAGCNDGSCPALIAVREDDLLASAQAALTTKGRR